MSAIPCKACVIRDERATDAAALICKTAFEHLSCSIDVHFSDHKTKMHMETITDSDLIGLVLSSYQFLYSDPSGKLCTAILNDHLATYYQNENDTPPQHEFLVYLCVEFLKIIQSILEEANLIEDGENIALELVKYTSSISPCIVLCYSKYP